MPRRTVSLFRRIERALETIVQGSTPLDTLRRVCQFLVDHFSHDLGLRGGRIYAWDADEYELVATFGEVARAPIGLRIPRGYPPFDPLLEEGVSLMRRSDARLDPSLEAEIGTRDWFAAIVVGDGAHVISFDLDSRREAHDEVVATLNIIRIVLNQKTRAARMIAQIEDARRIQESILPRKLPTPRDFQIAARSEAAEVVGGDFYDVITLGDTTFAVVVADATGHGLPAALQVRDVYTGLRMGLSREFKLTRTLERLNRIIHRSRLATNFVSLFLAEIDLNGSVTYCNAGHPPALLVRPRGTTQRLSSGGMLLGINPNATYGFGLATMGPGDTLVLYSDGITEARHPGTDEEFSEARLVELLRRTRGLTSRAIVDRIFDEVAAFSAAPAEDDRTVVVVKRRVPTPKESTP
jgi:serine phosphatase RsbU (regulator of sigma subunit)